MKNKYDVFEIDCEGDMKKVFEVTLEHVPNIGESLSYIDLETANKVVYNIDDIIYPVIPKGELKDGTPKCIEYTKISPVIIVNNLYTQDITNIINKHITG